MAQKRRRLAERRKAVGLSQENLAERIGVDRSTVVRWERGDTRPHPWHRPRLARALAVSIEELAELLAGSRTGAEPVEPGPAASGAAATGGPSRRHPQAEQLIRMLRERLLSRATTGPEATGTGRELAGCQAAARRVHEAYQRADYQAAVRLLPALITDAERLSRAGGGPPEPVHRLLAVTYLAASKLASKLGDGTLAWLAADRAVAAALAVGDRAAAAAGAYQVARALVPAPGRLDDAADVLDRAVAELAAGAEPDHPEQRAVRGALLLLAAVVAARRGRPVVAGERLATAAELATRQRRDDNLLWTGFGPTNVRIHRVTVAVELRQPARAIEIGDRIDTSTVPPLLASRRAQVHLDLAAAFQQTTGGGPAAVLHLLEAERIAPELVHIGHSGRSLVAGLLRQERRATTPGLRELAARAGVLA